MIFLREYPGEKQKRLALDRTPWPTLKCKLYYNIIIIHVMVLMLDGILEHDMHVYR